MNLKEQIAVDQQTSASKQREVVWQYRAIITEIFGERFFWRVLSSYQERA